MSTKNKTAPEVKPALRNDIVATITPEEIEAAMLRLLSEAKSKHSGITIIAVYARQYDAEKAPRTDWQGHGPQGVCCVSQPSYVSTVHTLHDLMGSPADIAMKLRAEAADKIAAAERIEAGMAEKAAA